MSLSTRNLAYYAMLLACAMPHVVNAAYGDVDTETLRHVLRYLEHQRSFDARDSPFQDEDTASGVDNQQTLDGTKTSSAGAKSSKTTKAAATAAKTGGSPHKSGVKLPKAAIIGIAVGGGVLLLLAFVLVCCCMRRRSQRAERDARREALAEKERDLESGSPEMDQESGFTLPPGRPQASHGQYAEPYTEPYSAPYGDQPYGQQTWGNRF